MNGRKIMDVLNKVMNSGEQKIMLSRDKNILAEGNYVFQLNVENIHGTFRQCKVMTIK